MAVLWSVSRFSFPRQLQLAVVINFTTSLTRGRPVARVAIDIVPRAKIQSSPLQCLLRCLMVAANKAVSSLALALPLLFLVMVIQDLLDTMCAL